MLFGCCPFFAESREDLLEEIFSDGDIFGKGEVKISLGVKFVLGKMLERDPEKRIGHKSLYGILKEMSLENYNN